MIKNQCGIMAKITSHSQLDMSAEFALESETKNYIGDVLTFKV